MSRRRHTSREVSAGVAALERDGWSINEDGTITRAQLQAKRLRYDPRARKAAPRYLVGRTTISASDLIEAKFGLAAKKRPNEGEVGLGLSFTPETCPEPAREGCDEAEVGLRLSFAPETCPEPARVGSRPAQRGPCARCGGFMVRGDGNEHRCLQCGRTNTPQRVLTPTERIWFRKG